MAENQSTFDLVFMFADIVGSTPFKESHSFDEGFKKTKEHNNLIAKCIKNNNGKLFKLLGDGIIVMFSGDKSHFNAVKASLESLIEIDKFNETSDYKKGSKHDYKIETRIGISFGKVIEYNIEEIRDLVGECIDESQRLCSISTPNSITFKKEILDKIVKEDIIFFKNNNRFFSNIVDNIKVKGKRESIDVCLISLEDIINSGKTEIAKKYESKSKNYFLNNRSINESRYIAVGGFMFTGKGIIAENIAKKFNMFCIKDDFKKNIYLPPLYEILNNLPKGEFVDEISKRSLLTNLWFLNNKFNLIYKSIIKNREKFNYFVSDFHLDCDFLYCFAELNKQDRELISDVYDKFKASNNFVKPKAVIFLNASAKYLLEKKNSIAKSDQFRNKLEKNITQEYIELVLKTFDLYKEQLKDIPSLIIDIETENIENENSPIYNEIENFLNGIFEIR